ncbi:MAG TPA: hypothetical protein VGY58_07300 [Gemmataceae bacterium]|jgi:hypothetical protein|nr:hypothetical protein [Gemmataceae bacterium]
MSAPSQAVPPSRLTQRLAALPVVIPQPEQVAGYLECHADVEDLLPLVCQSARMEFGEEVELSLELYRDPEIPDCYLTLYVRQPVYDRLIMARIESVRARYRDELSERSGWLHVTTDFRPPSTKHAI